IVATTSQEPSSPIADQSILTLDLSEEITDAKPKLDPSEVVGQALSGDESARSIALRSVLESVEKAATDDRIVGLYLYGSLDPTSSGFATLREVRQALEKFRDSGKPIYAYDRESWQERDYYLASVANQVIQNPGSTLEMNGFSLENAFFAGALQKYGIGIQVLRVGKYKSAVEPFTRTSSSPENKEQTQKLLTDLWNDFRTAAATSRKLTVDKIQTIADQQAVLLPSEAQAAGLIDKVAYEDEIVAELEKLTGQDTDTHSFRQISMGEYADAIDLEHARNSENRVAVVYAEGEIVNGFGSTRSIGGESLVETLREVRQDDQIKAVVLRVNSPGGSASASEQIAREVLLTTKVKPVIVSMGNYAASGGYQISTFA
ncbi:MAG TPA: signal peptide peptidase SppA, partial [Allocoleopsis sp.]